MKQNLDQKIRASRKGKPKTSVIYGFDRITFWLDRGELPFDKRLIEDHCRRIEVEMRQAKFQARWKCQLKVFQPTIRCLEILARELGYDISVLVNYVEIAFDLPATTSSLQALLRRDSFLASAMMPYQRQPVVLNERNTTWYYGRRTYENGSLRPHVLAVYADKPSKLNNAQPGMGSLPCTHIEHRGKGSPALAKIGIASQKDLIQFDHKAFWEKNIRLYQLPKQKTVLGRLLAIAAGDDPEVSGSALRKRASRWVEMHSIDDGVSKVFVMANALLATPILERMLQRISFSEWLDHALSL